MTKHATRRRRAATPAVAAKERRPDAAPAAERIELMPVGTLVKKRPPLASAIRSHLSFVQKAMVQWLDGEIEHDTFDREMTHGLQCIGALTVDVEAIETDIVYTESALDEARRKVAAWELEREMGLTTKGGA